MPLNHVSAEAPIRAHRTFEVDDRSGAKVFQTRSIECFARKFGCETGFVVLANRKADAINRNTRAGGHTFKDSAGANAKRSERISIALFFDGSDLADFFNDSREHRR